MSRRVGVIAAPQNGADNLDRPPVTPVHQTTDFQQRQAAAVANLAAPDAGGLSSAASSPAASGGSPYRMQPQRTTPAMMDSSSSASSLGSSANPYLASGGSGTGLGILTPATSTTGSSPGKLPRRSGGNGGGNPQSSTRSSPGGASSPSSLKNGSAASQSQTPRAPPPLDLPQAMARANGDPLLALQQVLAERNQLAGENAQLWKLLDKQRDRVAVYKAERDAERHKRHQQHQQQLQAGGQPQLQPRVQSLQGDGGTQAGSPIPPYAARTGSPLASRQMSSPPGSSQSSPTLPTPSDGSPRPAHGSRALFFDAQLESGSSVPAPAPPATARQAINGDLPRVMLADDRDRDRTPVSRAGECSSSAIDEETPVKHRRTDSGSLLPSALIGQSKAIEPQSTTDSGLLSAQSLPQSEIANAQRRKELESRMSFDPDVKHYLSMMATPQSETFSNSVTKATAEGDADEEALARLMQIQALSDPQAPLRDIPPPENITRGPAPSRPDGPFPAPNLSSRQQNPQQPDSFPSSSRSSPMKAPPPASGPPQAPAQSVPNLTSRTLPFVSCSVLSSSMVTTAGGKDVPCLSIRVTLKPPQTGRTYAWTLAKAFPALVELDDAMRTLIGNKKAIKQSGIGSLPETKGWKDFAPTKLDQRKAAIEAYLQSVLSAPIEDKSPLARFLSSDIRENGRRGSEPNVGVKAGYLTKKGKNLRGWKSRWFLLDGPTLHYFEQRGGPLLGSISIVGAQIGTQNKESAAESADEKSYRHAFLILEAKRPGIGGPTKHVLCAESDEERDGWVQILVRHVNGQYVSQVGSEAAAFARPEMPRSETSSTVASDVSRPPNSRQASRDDVKIVRASAQPIRAMSQDSNNAKLFSGVNPSVINSREEAMARTASPPAPVEQEIGRPMPAFAESPISGPPSASWMGQDDKSSVLSADSGGSMPMRNNRQSVAPPRRDIAQLEPSRGSPDRMPLPRQSISNPTGGVVIPHGAKFGGKDQLLSDPSSRDRDRERKARSMRIWGFGKSSTGPAAAAEPARHVFGVPLEEALDVATIEDVPAIVYRCISYLQTKNAHKEEGIFRLSGSTAVVKGLRDRFDANGDFDLLANDQRWDLHAIAGLLKMFLRELPTSILTKEMQMDFVRANENPDRMERMPDLARLITELPEPNFYLLRALCRHLTLVVANSNLNKMTLRNIGIVFSPTLGIPAGLFSDMICHYRYIFDGDLADLQPVEEEVAARAASGLVVPPVPSVEAPPVASDDEAPYVSTNRRNRQSHVYVKPPAIGSGSEHPADLSAINEDEETIRDDVFLAPASPQQGQSVPVLPSNGPIGLPRSPRLADGFSNGTETNDRG